MLFRPSFCANCGEKIERAEWYIWTSRRFCPVCESEFKGHDLIPRAIVGIGILVGVFGFGSYLKSGSATPDSQLVRQTRKPVEQTAPAAQMSVTNMALPPQGNANAAQTKPQDTQILALQQKTLAGSQTSADLQKPKTETGEALYYCGAETKKGTPCTRRVKGNIRCFQHVGMPAMLPSEKLRIK